MMESGFNLQKKRIEAYRLTRKACVKCCEFLQDRFVGLNELDDDIDKLRSFKNELTEIVIEIDKLELGGGA